MSAKTSKEHVMDMCEGPLLKKLLIFSLPLMASSMLQLLFNAADIIVVGRFAGDHSLAAVGSTASLINLLVNLFVGLSIGTNVLVAQYYGANKEKELSATVHTSIAISIISGIALTVVGVIGTPVILELMQAPKEVLDLAVIYLRTYFLGMTATMIYNFGAAILRAVGDTKRPLIYLSIAGVINVVFNLIFVICFHWGVFGVGSATVISQIVSAVLIVRCLMKETGAFRLYLNQIRVKKDKLIQILKIGLPAGFQGVLFSVSNVCIQASVNSFGATVVAGNSAAGNVEGFVYVAMNTFYQAAISFTSQNYGAKKYQRIDRIAWLAVMCGTVAGTVLGISAYLGGPWLLRLYTTSDKVIKAGLVRMFYICVPYALCGIMDVLVGVLRGVGYSVVPMFVSLIGVCGLRLLWLATVFQIDRFHTIEMVYIVYPITWLLTIIAHLITYMRIRKKIRKN